MLETVTKAAVLVMTVIMDSNAKLNVSLIRFKSFKTNNKTCLVLSNVFAADPPMSIIIVGGEDENGDLVSTVEMYDVPNKMSCEAEGFFPNGVYGLEGAWVKGKARVCGGQDVTGNERNDCLVFNKHNQAW